MTWCTISIDSFAAMIRLICIVNLAVSSSMVIALRPPSSLPSCRGSSSSVVIRPATVALSRNSNDSNNKGWCCHYFRASTDAASTTTNALVLHASVSPTTKAELSSKTPPTPRELVRQGMEYFRQYDVPTSLAYFDLADSLSTTTQRGTTTRLTPYLWQRGISYYYLNKYNKGHDQFVLDVSVNPKDVEEIVWDIACLAQMNNNDNYSKLFPPEKSMKLPIGQTDNRPIMSAVYSLFQNENGVKEYDLRKAGYQSSNVDDEFYSLFYLALYCEIRNENGKAEAYMRSATECKYALMSNDYMVTCAKVHCRLRNWEL